MTETTGDGAEAKYRQLFDTLIEGFCTIEMIFDAGGKPVDYRFLEINPAFEQHTGLTNARAGSCASWRRTTNRTGSIFSERSR